MDRRGYLSTLLIGGAGVFTGCSALTEEGSTPTETPTRTPSETANPTSTPTATVPNVDTGVVYEGELRNLRNWMVEVVSSQSVTVSASDVDDGELLWFQVGDGTGFVHSHRFYEQDSGTTNEYQFESDGRHQLQLSPKRHEAPMNEDVTIAVTMELTEL